MSELPSRDLQWARSHLREAEKYATQEEPSQKDFNLQIWASVGAILSHLESQSAPQPARESEKPSSVATGQRWAMKVTSRTSQKWSFPVSHTGSLSSSQQQDILAWLSSLWTVGDGLEVEIGVTRIPKVSTPLDGQPSPTPGLSGHAGSYEQYYSADMGDYVCPAEPYGDTPNLPCFYMADSSEALRLKLLLNRAISIDLPSSGPSASGDDVEAILSYLRDKFVRKFGASASTNTPCKECGERLGVHLYADCPSPASESASTGGKEELDPYLRNPAAIVPALIPDDELRRFDGQWVSIHDYRRLLAFASPAAKSEEERNG